MTDRPDVDSGSELDPVDGALIADLRAAYGFDEADQAPGQPVLVASTRTAFGQLAASDTLASGTRLGDFEIIAELGRGGMGVVYRARQVSLSREVALKVLPTYARHSPRAIERFRAEAQAAARLHHTNIVAIYAQGDFSGQYYYAMELIDGMGLDVVVRSRPDLLSSTGGLASSALGRLSEGRAAAAARQLEAGSETRSRTSRAAPPPEAPAGPPAGRAPELHWTMADYRHVATLFAGVADALACAHASGVIHRDIKPHNLLLGPGDRLHLTDFGLARLADEPHLTLSGEVMGTPAYLSPEQVRGEVGKIDHRTDIFSLGVTLYEVLTRCKPFDGDTRDQIMHNITSAEPLPPRRIDRRIPFDLETICLRAIEKEPTRRHVSAAELADDLRRFAEGRPILSRRTSSLVKLGKWVRRHKAQTTAFVALAAVALLAGAYGVSVATARRQAAEQAAASRQHEAAQLLREAYDHLAYLDYRTPERVRPQIERAAELDAAARQLDLVQALAGVGASDPTPSLERLQRVVAANPGDQRAWYILAWVQRRLDPAASRAAFDQAEKRGPPTAADAWFFRGLVLHFDDPAAAIESYRQANAARSREAGFYPQALLHLARARNQQLYTTRTLEPFSEADENLRLLIRNGYYGAYPYYLLSISHRLAAEIYQGSAGTRRDESARHYEESLDAARRGQALDAADDRPITAEAECLESMGRYAEAVEARTRAIAAARSEAKRCEGYNYRWRLYYWLGQWDAAREDVTRHAACEPDSLCYAHVYPALIAAEQGHMDDALAAARAPASDRPTDAVSVLWSATTLRLLGQGAEADALLAERAAQVDFEASPQPPQTAGWLRALYAYCQTGEPGEPLAALAAQSSAPWRLMAEAYFHDGARRLAAGDRAGALKSFGEAYRSFDGEARYTFHARLLCVRMSQDSTWPPWLDTVSW